MRTKRVLASLLAANGLAATHVDQNGPVYVPYYCAQDGFRIRVRIGTVSFALGSAIVERKTP
jgi:hypothetical protein